MGDVLGIKNMSKHFFFVTDQGSNIQSALSIGYGFSRIACACHCLATAVRHALPDGPCDKGDSAELRNLLANITAVKSLVQCFKRSGLNAMLQKTLLQENNTRWNTMLMMLESVIGQKETIREFLKEKAEDQRIDTIDFSLLKDVVLVLKPLKEATKYLEGEKYPTIHRVYLWYNKLQQQLKPCQSDNPLIAQLKFRMAAFLKDKFQMTTIHKLALFLHPQYKMLRKLDQVDRQDVKSMARDLISALHASDQITTENNGSESTSTSQLVLNHIHYLFTTLC